MYAESRLVAEQSRLNDNVKIIKRARATDDAAMPIVETKKVAAYCRVSTDLEVQESSLDLQMESFKRIIENHPGWELAGIFADEGITGTMSDKRLEFQRMMESARQGMIDVILVKSISRFARNTADSLRFTRELTEMGVGIYFEKEGIDTSSIASELLLTIFAAFAQEESHSISENIKTGLRNRFKIGQIPWYTVYGYRQGWIIEESEAEVIRRMFNLYANGATGEEIAQKLNSEDVPTPRKGDNWSKNVVMGILKNEKYVGDARMQKTYVENFMTHKRADNMNAKIDQYYKKDNHEAIVDRGLFNEVQRIINMQNSSKGAMLFPYYGFLKCPCCGKPMIKVWIAGTIRQSAWTCGGEGPKELLAQRTSCPTYLLQERLMERTLFKAVQDLDKVDDRNKDCYKDILLAQSEIEKGQKLSYVSLKNLIESISLDGWDNLAIKWKMGWEGEYPLDFTKAAEAVMPDVQIRDDGASCVAGFAMNNRKAFLDGFKGRQKKILKYRIIEPLDPDTEGPTVLRGEDD